MRLFKLGGILGVAAALYVGWLMLRDAPLFRVDKVAVTGLGGSASPVIRTRLEQAGLGMTTTHVDRAALDQAVAAYSVVKSLQVSTQFPHGMTIRVIEQLPVAQLVVGTTRLGVAADGTIVQGLAGPTVGLPSVTATILPTTDQVSDPGSLEALEILDIAPTVLRREITRVGTGPGGLTVHLRNGPELYFGDTTRLHAKWAAAARVLGDPASRGAAYLDVRLPERPAAGIADPQTSAAATAGQQETAGAPLVPDQTTIQPSTSSGG